jgi:MOSC domain-containing protein YiiM
MKELSILMNKFGVGVVSRLLIRPARREAVKRVKEVEAIAGKGLKGDRYRSNGSRQVTLIQAEHLDVIGSVLKKVVDPDLTRRNLVIAGINLLSLKGRRFRIGEAVLEYSGECHPCSRMEENLGEGGYNAMRGHGGITARVVTSGLIREGDPVTVDDELSQ